MKFKEYFKEMMVKRFDLDSRVGNDPMIYEDDTKYHGKVLEVRWIDPKKIKRLNSNEVGSVLNVEKFIVSQEKVKCILVSVVVCS